MSCSSSAGSVLLVHLPARAVLAFMAHVGGFITKYVLAFILRGNRVA